MKPIVKLGVVVACALILWSGLRPAEQTVSIDSYANRAPAAGPRRPQLEPLPQPTAVPDGLVEQPAARRTATAPPSPSPHPPPPTPVPYMPGKSCVAGCEKHGVCNPELGRCDCPPFMGGADCSKPLFSACAASIGLKEVTAAPCVIDHLGGNAPVSCECLLECEALGLMGVRECYIIDKSNQTVVSWVRGQRGARGLDANEQYWEENLKGAEAASVERCSGRGVFAPPKPPQGAGRGPARCMCYPGFSGPSCERSTLSRSTEMCLNGCSRRGKCVRNWCHCTPPFYGVDCSLGEAAPGQSAAPLLPPIGAQKAGEGAPRIYVYELPPEFNAWMQAGAGGWWQARLRPPTLDHLPCLHPHPTAPCLLRPLLLASAPPPSPPALPAPARQELDLWGEDVVFHKRMLRSTYRTTNPEEADYFYVPVWVSSAMWQMNWGFRDLLPTGVRTVKRLAQYLQATWPYFDRKGGADHIWVFGHDQGAWRVRMKLPLIGKGIFLSPFGAGPAQRGGHIKGQDIVVPPLLYANVPVGLLNHAGRRRVEPPDLAFFQGKLNLHIPYEYSFGIRQGLYKAHRTTPRMTVKEGHEANTEHYFEHMSASWWKVPPTLSEDTAPSARRVAPKALLAPTDPEVPPEQLGSSQRPQHLSADRTKGEESPRFNQVDLQVLRCRCGLRLLDARLRGGAGGLRAPGDAGRDRAGLRGDPPVAALLAPAEPLALVHRHPARRAGRSARGRGESQALGALLHLDADALAAPRRRAAAAARPGAAAPLRRLREHHVDAAQAAAQGHHLARRLGRGLPRRQPLLCLAAQGRAAELETVGSPRVRPAAGSGAGVIS